MGAFREWVQNLVVFLIFMTMVEQLIPDTKYRKYIRLTMGLVLILVLLTPLLKSMGMEEEIYRNFIKGNIQTSATDARVRGKIFDADSLFNEGYINLIYEEVRAYFDSNGMIVKYCELDVNEDSESEDYGKIYSMQIGVLPKDKNIGIDDASSDITSVDGVNIPDVRIGEFAGGEEVSYVPNEKIKQWKMDLSLQFGIDSEQLKLEILS